jgi:hypothetical protein
VGVPALFESRAGVQEKIGAAVTLVMPWGTPAAVVSACGLLAALAALGGEARARTMAG